MEVNETMSKQITETAYLTTENTKRYRPILRYFYEQYERINYMLYKEDVWNELQGKPNFENYTIEMCKNDLAGLVNLWNLTALQDTNNVLTVEEFKHRKYRKHRKNIIKKRNWSIKFMGKIKQRLQKIKSRLPKKNSVNAII